MKCFFANMVVNPKILEIKKFVKGRRITVNEKYLCNLLKLKLNGPRITLGNLLVTTILALIRETQLRIMFGLDFSSSDGMPAHKNPLLESYILQNMITQMIIPRTIKRNEVTYMDM